MSQQMSGFVIAQTDNPLEGVGKGIFSHAFYAKNFEQFYGTGNSFSARKFVWTSGIELDFVMPVATLAGAVYQGTLPLNSLFKSDVLSVNDLIRISQSAKTMQKGIKLQSAIKNNILGSVSIGGEAPSLYISEQAFLGSEIVSYAVVQTASQSITEAAERPYTLLGNVHGNFGFYPEAADSFLYNLFRLDPYKIGKSDLDDVPYFPLTKYNKPPQSRKEIDNFVDELSDITDQTCGETMSAGSLCASDLNFTRHGDASYNLRLFLHAKSMTTKQAKDALNEYERLGAPPGPMIAGGFRLLSSVAPLALSAVSSDNVTKEQMKKTVGKKLTNFLYGTGDQVKPSALSAVGKLMSSSSAIARKNISPDLQPKPNPNKKKRQKKAPGTLVKIASPET